MDIETQRHLIDQQSNLKYNERLKSPKKIMNTENSSSRSDEQTTSIRLIDGLQRKLNNQMNNPLNKQDYLLYNQDNYNFLQQIILCSILEDLPEEYNTLIDTFFNFANPIDDAALAMSLSYVKAGLPPYYLAISLRAHKHLIETCQHWMNSIPIELTAEAHYIALEKLTPTIDEAFLALCLNNILKILQILIEKSQADKINSVFKNLNSFIRLYPNRLEQILDLIFLAPTDGAGSIYDNSLEKFECLTTNCVVKFVIENLIKDQLYADKTIALLQCLIEKQSTSGVNSFFEVIDKQFSATQLSESFYLKCAEMILNSDFEIGIRIVMKYFFVFQLAIQQFQPDNAYQFYACLYVLHFIVEANIKSSFSTIEFCCYSLAKTANQDPTMRYDIAKILSIIPEGEEHSILTLSFTKNRKRLGSPITQLAFDQIVSKSANTHLLTQFLNQLSKIHSLVFNDSLYINALRIVFASGWEEGIVTILQHRLSIRVLEKPEYSSFNWMTKHESQQLKRCSSALKTSKFWSILESVDISTVETPRPATRPQNPEILLKAQSPCTNQDTNGSHGKATGRRNLKQTLETIPENAQEKNPMPNTTKKAASNKHAFFTLVDNTKEPSQKPQLALNLDEGLEKSANHNRLQNVL